MNRTLALTLALFALSTPTPARAQSLLERSPNMAAGWVGRAGSLYFNFLHRFETSAAPQRKVSNVPTLTLAAGLPLRTLVGAHYATNSQLAPGYPNEWEFFARTLVLSQDAGAPLDAAIQLGYNLAAAGLDGEVAFARSAGPLRATAAARVLADPWNAGATLLAPALGATLRLSDHIALAGDVARVLDGRAQDRTAWSAGIHVALPLTPHTLSLHAANTNAVTLQGSSRGEERVRWGFEFTIPVTLARYLPRPKPAAAVVHAVSSAPAPVTAPATAPASEVVNASIRALAFAPATIEIAAGTTIEWKNEDPVAHTVTAEDGGFDSGFIQPGETWRYTFEKAGTYPFYCMPHPFMKGTVVVK